MSCLYIRKLEDVDLDVLGEIVERSVRRGPAPRRVDYSDSSFEKRKLQWLAPPARVWVRSRRMPRVA